MIEIKLFNRWSVEGVKVADLGLVNYVTLNPKILPKTGARYIGNRFHKSYTFIVERLVTKILTTGHKAKKHFISSGHHAGKKDNALKIVESALAKCEVVLKKNPIEVFVKALENAAPREEVISIEYGGARYPKAVDVAPQRRVDLALRFMTQGAFVKSFNKKKNMESCLAEEIIEAYRCSAKSNAIAKKRDLERQSASSK